MARQTLNSGDLWAAANANAAGFPQLTGEDEYGHGPKVVDDWLSDEPNAIKANFYGWFNRLEISDGGGRNIDYTNASVMLNDGSVVQINAGSITIPANSTRFVYVSEAGAVTNADNLAPLCLPLGFVETNSSNITNIVDLRSQVLDQVRPVAQADSNGFQIGDLKETCRQVIEPGWALCDGQQYNAVDYPLAWDAIGRVNSLSSDPPNTFRTPPPGRMYIGAGAADDLTTRTIGQSGGAESVALTEANNARHAHAVTVAPHSHSATSNHNHRTTPVSHHHNILGSTETSDGRVDSIIREGAGVAGETGGNKGYTLNNADGQQIIQSTFVDIGIRDNDANVIIAQTAPTANAARSGNGTPHENMPPFFVVNKIIRLS